MNREKPASILTERGFRVALLLILGIGAISLCTPYPAMLVRALREKPEPIVRVEEKIIEVPVEVRVEVPAKPPELPKTTTPQDIEAQPWHPHKLMPMPEIQLPPFPPALPEKMETGTFEHVAALARGMHLRSTLTFHPGTTASQDRKKKQAYLIKLGMELLLPHAAQGKELLAVNPALSKVLPKYHELMEKAHVSRWYHALYLHKQNHARKNLAALLQPLDKHNFYDTDTILEITAPHSHRRVLWMQADMDIVSDGSDGDRLPTMPEAIRKSDNYQPTTSYRWKKRGSTPNPLLARWEARLAKLQKDKPKNAAAIDYAKRVIWDLKKYSYLLAQYDPFIVIPLTLKEGRDDTYRPAPGDYAVVIVGKRVFPAIVGDYGPKHKSGEASLRLGKLVNPKADVYARPVSSLEVSYLIFPHSKEEENGPIDYERLNTRCRELLDELGGLGDEAEFIEAIDLLAPKPAPKEEPPATKPAEDTSSDAPAPKAEEKTPDTPTPAPADKPDDAAAKPAAPEEPAQH